MFSLCTLKKKLADIMKKIVDLENLMEIEFCSRILKFKIFYKKQTFNTIF